MSDTSYEKAYFVQAKPAFLSLNTKQKKAHKQLCLLTHELSQGRDLRIPLSPQMEDVCSDLTCEEAAELSRASYFAGHRGVEKTGLFPNIRGESWKVSNVLDQILHSRLDLPNSSIEIHKGILRRTWSGMDYWIWGEFGLATEKNLESYRNFKVVLNSVTLQHNLSELAQSIGDLWPDVDTLEDNEEYIEFLKEKVALKHKAEQSRKERRIV